MGNPCLIIPGLLGSGPDHWQTRWEAVRDDCTRVDLTGWDNPRRETWVAALDGAIGGTDRPILVGHSLGCHAIAWWTAMAGERAGLVAGALLVAPPDVERAGCDPRLQRFAPTCAVRLPFPTVLVASRTDRYATLDRALAMAARWNAAFVDIGDAGHINAESGLGDWPAGQDILDTLLRRADPAAAKGASLSRTKA
jgi:predicted alpha/beta hydrolase family esterase